MEAYFEQIFKELPFGLGIAILVFLGILLIIWLLLPLWVLFVQWNTGKIREEVRRLADAIENKDGSGRDKPIPGPRD